MINKIQTLGFAFVAITAMSAIAASAAHAGTLQIGATPAVITGHSDPKSGEPTKSQEHIFTIKNRWSRRNIPAALSNSLI